MRECFLLSTTQSLGYTLACPLTMVNGGIDTYQFRSYTTTYILT